MKRYVCKDKLKTGTIVIIMEFLSSLLFILFIMLMGNFETKIIFTSIIVGLSYFAPMILVTLIELKQYFGKILIEDDKINLYLFSKEYSIIRGQICIMYIEPEKSDKLSEKLMFSIRLRIKGEKEIIPIKIMDYEIIQEIFDILIIRKEPQDFMFEWEK